jgi:hypothetical protein
MRQFFPRLSPEAKMTQLEDNIQTVEKRVDTKKESALKPKMPPAGPHARAELTNWDACPGAGALPCENELGNGTDPGAG